VQYARASARSTQCKSNLRQIGLAIDQFVDKQGARGRYPNACQMPTQEKVPPILPPLFTVIGDHIENQQEAFHCPSDVLDPSNATPVNGITYETYFQQEGLSYEYPSSKVANKTREQVRLGITQDLAGNTRPYDERSSSRVMILYDFKPFHGSVDQDGSVNWLYLDGHVDALIVADSN
jgi:prepilin-type processing-associated H-X9-DG protein